MPRKQPGIEALATLQNKLTTQVHGLTSNVKTLRNFSVTGTGKWGQEGAGAMPSRFTENPDGYHMAIGMSNERKMMK